MEKINWFERKLNKWVKLFEESEVTGANRHNELVSKINDTDKLQRRENQNIWKELKALKSQKPKMESKKKKRDDSISDDAHSSVSRQTTKRLNIVKPKKSTTTTPTAEDKKETTKLDEKVPAPTRPKMTLNDYKVKEHSLDGTESPTKVTRKESIEYERKQSIE